MTPASPRAFVLGWVAVVLLFVLAWLLFEHGMSGVHSFDQPGRIGAAAVGRPVPPIQVTALDGRETSLASYRGHPVWINFFATWCAPCKAEAPDIQRRYANDASRGLVVVGVDLEETRSAAAQFARRFQTTYPLLIDDGAAESAFDVQTIPVSVFVDRGGIIRAIRVGQMSPSAMDDALATIL